MNAYASIGIGQSLVRRLRRKTEEARTIIARKVVSLTENDYRIWPEAVGCHSTDRSDHETTTRL
jgi:hypothetical protein